MAHYAYVDESNLVTSVIVGPDEGTEPEGIDSWEAYFSAKGKGQAVRTSYNDNIRFNYAGIGYSYDAERDAFIPPTPYPSWVLDETTCLWVAPIDYPADGGQYVWDEETTDWVEVQDEAP